MKSVIKRVLFLTLSICILLSCATSVFAVDTVDYEYVDYSYNGLRATRILDDEHYYLSGLIDEEGNVVLPCEYEQIPYLADGIALVKKDGRYKLIELASDEIKLEFDQEYVHINDYNGTSGAACKSDGKYAIIDAEGRPTTDFIYTRVFRYSLNENLFFVSEASETEHSAFVYYGIVSKDGTVISEQVYREIQDASDMYSSPNLLIAAKAAGDEYAYGLVYGFLTASGEEKDFIYESISTYSEGYGSVKLPGSGWAIVDAIGKLLTDFIYVTNPRFSEGLAEIYTDGGTYYIDSDLNVAIEEVSEFKRAESYSLNFQNGYLWAIIDGETVYIESPIKQARAINIYINDTWLYTDQEPLIINDRTMVPIRALADALNYTVMWDQATKTVTVQNQKLIITMIVGESTATVNIFDDELLAEVIELDVPVTIVNGRTLLPLRFVAETLGADVEWDSGSVYVTY